MSRADLPCTTLYTLFPLTQESGMCGTFTMRPQYIITERSWRNGGISSLGLLFACSGSWSKRLLTSKQRACPCMTFILESVRNLFHPPTSPVCFLLQKDFFEPWTSLISDKVSNCVMFFSIRCKVEQRQDIAYIPPILSCPRVGRLSIRMSSRATFCVAQTEVEVTDL